MCETRTRVLHQNKMTGPPLVPAASSSESRRRDNQVFSAHRVLLWVWGPDGGLTDSIIIRWLVLLADNRF